ncbi:type II toxin-antitoxin system HipA family toxin [Piscinibacter sakaiensis]|uniref:HipA domain protein n=1 Tax=Piscinibacter sakaiensis TaxID=1547922 RepID=A0A0K8P1X9_PISS1|nr:type II toxin-antitoxin system HipA family toxin [Piscinibacter sakaiensis]GAP36559.1 HipA domain protein [Piscinibacter sakaiensis]
MSDTEKPVWVWLPAQSRPVRCGRFSLIRGVGTFHYDEDYLARPDALALDEFSLRFTRSGRGLRETRQGGLFGVFRDASPEGFGLALLEQLRGATLTDPMQRLEMSEGDSVGAVEVCDDIAAKLSFRAPASEQLLEVVAKLSPERASSQAAREVKGMRGTSLGGERPKLTVLHKGQHWIAKLQDRGDPPHAPLREYVAMRLARRCGITVADVEFAPVGEREVLLVRRFDRHVDDAGQVTRRLYASAHTVLRLDAQTRGERQRSYVALAYDMERWCGRADVNTAELKRELWRRMAFNAICGNGDDHPRNHGLLYRDGRWGLADAFDIAPYITFSGTLAMAITREGSSVASTGNLLKTCESFAVDPTAAARYIEATKDTVAAGWGEEQAACGVPPDTLPPPSFEWLADKA